MNPRKHVVASVLLLACSPLAWADEPVASYIFPAGGQRGTKCAVRVGGLNLHKGCGIDLLGPGLRAISPLARVPNTWFEGPVIPLPDSQLAEDYPQDYATDFEIASDAPLGTSFWRLSNSQGITPARRFIIGDLPEVVEDEIDGEPIPVAVAIPATINGRIFPREDVDIWSFEAKAGQLVRVEVCASRLGSPLEPRLELTDAEGRKLGESVGTPAREANLSFRAPQDGVYCIRIHYINFGGLQNYVYRLTLDVGPSVTAVYPLGARRGEKARFELLGSGVSNEPVEAALPASGEQSVARRFEIGGQLTNPVLVELGDLPEQLEHEANNDDAHAEPLAVSGIVNGRIQTPGDVDCFALQALKGQTFEFDLQASRLGSPLDAVLIISEASGPGAQGQVAPSRGKELVRCDDIAAGNTDAQCTFTASADGTYVVRVEDRLSSRGSPAFAYRLRVAQASPDFKLILASDSLNLIRGKEVKLKLDVEMIVPLGVPIDIRVEGLPEGVTVAPAQIAANAKQVELTFKVPEKTPIQTGRLVIRGTAKILDREITRTAALAVRRGEPTIEHVAWAVALPTPFKLFGTYKISFEPRGGFVTRHYRVLRNGFQGPLEVALADRQIRHLQGVTGPAVSVPAGAEEYDFMVYLPPWMDLGRTSRTVLAAAGTFEDFDGSRHILSFSGPEQNEQVVARVSSGLLTVGTDRQAILAQPGGRGRVHASVAQDPSRPASVKLELVVPRHIHGVKSESVVIDATQSAGDLTIDYDKECGPFNVPLVVRATTLDAKRPAVAETRLEIVAPR